VRELIEKVPGVASAEVSYDDEKAVVRYDSAKVQPPAIAKMLDGHGYRAWETKGERKQ
jgi:copper chaperone CopZ